jgi:YD repeat-containing protein
VTNVYDGFGRLVSSGSEMGGTARTIASLYDSEGNRTRITHPDDNYFTYETDGLGRPTWIRENGGQPLNAYTYDRAGRRATSGWGATTYGYDHAGRLQSLSHDLVGTSRDIDLGFTYNPAGQILSRSSNNDAMPGRAPSPRSGLTPRMARTSIRPPAPRRSATTPTATSPRR